VYDVSKDCLNETGTGAFKRSYWPVLAEVLSDFEPVGVVAHQCAAEWEVL
jgi:hypothetical protein